MEHIIFALKALGIIFGAVLTIVLLGEFLNWIAERNTAVLLLALAVFAVGFIATLHWVSKL